MTELDLPLLQINRFHRVHDAGHIRAVGKYRPQRLRNIRHGQSSHRYLVEKGLEKMVVTLIN